MPLRPALAVVVAAVALATLLPLLARAQEEPALVDARLEPASGTVGDRLTLTVEIAHPAGVTWAPPGFGADFGGLELLESPPPSTSEDGQATRFTYILAAFRTGPYTVPPLQFAYTGPGTASGTVSTPPLGITIDSVLTPGDSSLRPLKPQLDIGSSAPPAVVPGAFVAGFIALTALGYVLLARVRRLHARQLIVPRAAGVPAEQRARAALDALSNGASADVRSYYEQLAVTVRWYLSERFDFPAYAMTRTELEPAMIDAGADRWPAHLTANLLEQADVVQFAGFDPPPERRTADLTAAYEIITLTAPSTAPSTDPSAGDGPATA